MRSAPTCAAARILATGSALMRITTAPITLPSGPNTGRDEIAGFAPVPGHTWTVGVSESRDYFAAPLNRLFQNTLVSVALAGTVFLLLAMIFARSIVGPIQRINTAAHALKAGDYDKANIPVRSNDEIGQLARTFNVMIDVLRQRERERERRRAVQLGYEKDEGSGGAAE